MFDYLLKCVILLLLIGSNLQLQAYLWKSVCKFDIQQIQINIGQSWQFKFIKYALECNYKFFRVLSDIRYCKLNMKNDMLYMVHKLVHILKCIVLYTHIDVFFEDHRDWFSIAFIHFPIFDSSEIEKKHFTYYYVPS